MKEKPAPVASLAAQVVEKVDHMIASGQLVPGQRIVEAELAQSLGVSRLPIREALRILAGDGVIELVQNSSARVRRLTPRQINDMLKVLVNLMLLALDEVNISPRRDEIIAGLFEIAGRIDVARQHGIAREVVRLMVQYQEDLAAGSGNEYLSGVVHRARFGNYQAQVLALVESSVILETASEVYTPLTVALRDGRMDEAKALLSRSAAHLLMSW